MRRQILISAAMMLALSCSQGGKVDFPEPPDGYTLLLARTEAIGLGTSSHDASWESGARIGVFGSKSGNNAMYVLKKAGTGKTEAEFYGPLVSGSEVSAVYPYSEGYAASASAFPVKIPHEQALDTEKSMAEHFLSVCGSAFAFLDAGILRFHYPLGMLAVRFELESPIVVNSMMLKSMAEPLSGSGTLSADGKMTMDSWASSSILLDCGEGTGSQDNYFLFVMPPAVYGSMTLNVDVEGEGNIAFRLPEVEIKRISETGFPISSVTIKSDGLSGFGTEGGYLEGYVKIETGALSAFGVESGYLEED